MGLWKRAQEAAKDCPPEVFAGYPHADELRLGWYPNRFFFQDAPDRDFFQALPDLSCALVSPYQSHFRDLGFLSVTPYRDDGSLNVKRRRLVGAKRRLAKAGDGILGLNRLRGKHVILVVTDQEPLVAKQQGSVGVLGYSAKIGDFIQRSAKTVDLRGSGDDFFQDMASLAQHGVEVLVNGQPVEEYISRLMLKMMDDDMGMAAMTYRCGVLLKKLTPIQRVAVIQRIRQESGVDFERMLPDSFSIYRRESEFYDALERSLAERVSTVALRDNIIVVTDANGVEYPCPINNLAVQAVICQIMGARLDLLDWIYRDLKEIPHFYLYKNQELEIRSDVCRKIAEAITTILMRRALGKR